MPSAFCRGYQADPGATLRLLLIALREQEAWDRLIQTIGEPATIDELVMGPTHESKLKSTKALLPSLRIIEKLLACQPPMLTIFAL